MGGGWSTATTLFSKTPVISSTTVPFPGLCACLCQDLVVFVGGKGANIWGEEKGVDDLLIDSDKAGIDSSL